MAAIGVEGLRTLVPPLNDLLMRYVPIFKDRERWTVTGATYMILGAAVCFSLFSKEIAVLSLLFLVVGDPAAAVIGVRDRWLRLFGKSLAGTAAFATFAALAGLAATLHPALSFAWWIVPGAIAAALAELAPSPIDDNITVPVVAGATMTALAWATQAFVA